MEHEFQFFSDDYVFEEEDNNEGSEEERTLKVRLDKWLWAARFFKTRAVARAAVEKGRVFYNGERSKPSREIELGATLQIRQGRFEKTVIVKGLSTRRRSTDEAFALFEETEESRVARDSNPYNSNPNPYQPNQSFEPRQNPELGEPPKERRVVRFLRRSFLRGEPRQERQSSSKSTQEDFGSFE